MARKVDKSKILDFVQSYDLKQYISLTLADLQEKRILEELQVHLDCHHRTKFKRISHLRMNTALYDYMYDPDTVAPELYRLLRKLPDGLFIELSGLVDHNVTEGRYGRGPLASLFPAVETIPEEEYTQEDTKSTLDSTCPN